MIKFSFSKFHFFVIVFVLLNTNLTWAQHGLTDTVFKYFPGTMQPDVSWNSRIFDDSGWMTGYFSIGWGDNDDSTKINLVPSCYLRYKFNVEDKSLLHELVLRADFDDGFVAYINGAEIVRVNMGKFKSPTTNTQLTERSHEAENYRRLGSKVVQGYFIDDTIINNHIVDGMNVLAIEVHNDSINGSDLSMNCYLINTEGYYSLYNTNTRYKRPLELDSTILPIVKIESDEFGIEASHVEVQAQMGVINNGSGQYNHINDSYTDYSGQIRIEVRGQSSADFPKRSYNIELQDINGNDTSVALMGMPKESDWVLQGPFADKSQIRNAMIYELGRRTGHWNPRTAFCEVILNGEFIGLYMMVEDIKRDTFRLDIANLNPDEISGNDVTGGYIIKYDKGGNETQIQIVYPKEKDLQPEQQSYINGFIAKYESKLRSNYGLDADSGYKKYIDYNSLIDYMIVVELSKNCDSYLYSSYMHKDRDDRNNKLIYGPLWDFDLCFGNSIYQQGDLTYNWQFAYPQNNRFKITRLLQDSTLADLFEERWTELRSSFLSDANLIARIDSMTNYLAGPIERNYLVWPVIKKDLFATAYYVQNYEEEIDYMKNWLTTRTAWIDANISKIKYPVTVYPSEIENPIAENLVEGVYPNPFTNEFNVALNLQNPSNIALNLISINGSVNTLIAESFIDQGNYIMHWKVDKYYPMGMYLLEVRIDGEFAGHYKILKLEE